MNTKQLNLTYPQKAIWNTEQFYPNTSINTISGKISIHSKLDCELLKKAIFIFIENTDNIRYQFHNENDVITQYIKDYSPFAIEHVKLNSDNEEEIANSIAKKSFLLYDSPLYYFKIFENPDQTGGFFVCLHHLISDAWSMSLLVSSIISIYSKLLKKQIIDIESLSLNNYSDFIEQEYSYQNSSRFENDKLFWSDTFDQYTIDSSLSGNNSLSTALSCKASRAEFKLSKNFTLQITTFCKENKISPFTFLLLVLGIYESKVNQTNHIILSTPILNRTSLKDKNTLGLFVNNMLFKLALCSDESFYNTALDVVKKQFSYLRHQKYPAQNIIADIKSKYNIKENIYQTSISYQNARMNHNEENVDYDSKWLFSGYSSIPLLFHIYDMDDTNMFTFMYDYQNNVYQPHQVKDIHNRLLHICKQVIENKDILIKDIELATQEEKDMILNEFNNTFVPYDKEQTVLDLWNKQVVENPNKIAIICNNVSITFKELDSLSNNISYCLQKKYHLNSGNNVSVVMDRSIYLVATILAILKCGCSYVLIDHSHPLDRKIYMVENSDSIYVISNLNLNFQNSIDFEDLLHMPYMDDYESSCTISDNAMYLLYTSGSTGNPKAVTVTHRNFHNYLLGISKMIDYSKEKVVLSIASISFDVFGFELWVTILNGLTLILSTSEEQNDFLSLNNLILNYHVNVLYGTPSKIQSLMSSSNSRKSFSFLTDIGIGGESINFSFLKDLSLLTSANIYNMYGPTETTIGCSCKKFEKNSKIITIGKPSANVKFYVLDKNFKICPPGVKGELYISGDGVSKGYYKNAELNEKSFLNDIFTPGLTMYKSGDLVSWTSQGELVFYGRADSQIKIRGYRIELSEIENVLSSHQFIKNCAVIDYVHNDREFLCAYYTSDFTIQTYELKVFLSNKLPYYMIPSYFIPLPILPLTVNGKIDKKKLPSPFKFTQNEKYIKPKNELQEKICTVMENCLSIKNLSIYEDFNNIGIDSLSIIKMQSQLSSMNLSIPTQYFYDYSNVKDLSFALEHTNSSDNTTLVNDNYPFLKHDIASLKIEPHSFKNILLTGGTGFLGIHILEKLLHECDKIYCIIRSSSLENAKKRLTSMFNFYFEDKYTREFLFNKIEILVGDITDKNLGLSEDLLSSLGSKIDLVIHSAALVKHFGKYDEFKKMNLNGTKNVANFCMENHIGLNYISTISVSGDFMPLSTTSNDVAYTEESFFIGQNYNENYYIKSKLLTEEYLLHNIKLGLLHANIFRVGNLTGRHSDGHFQYNIDSNAFYNKLEFVLKNGFFYESGTLQEFDMSPVDEVANAIVSMLENYGLQNKIFHIFNPYKFTMKTLIEMLNYLGYSIKIVNDHEFYKKISKMDLSSNSLIISDYNLYTNISYLNIKTTCDITQYYLDKIPFHFQKLDLEYISKLIEYMKKIKII